jgi:hypothetical protein
MKDETYNKRTWLNPVSKDGTSSIVAFNGNVTDFKGKTYPSTFLEVSDCQNKIRLHQTSDDSREDFVNKMKLLRSEIELFINHLEPSQSEPKPIAYEFQCLETGHCYVDYIKRKDLEEEGSEYKAIPLYLQPVSPDKDKLSAEEMLKTISKRLWYKYGRYDYWNILNT